MITCPESASAIAEEAVKNRGNFSQSDAKMQEESNPGHNTLELAFTNSSCVLKCSTSNKTLKRKMQQILRHCSSETTLTDNFHQVNNNAFAVDWTESILQQFNVLQLDTSSND